MKKCEMKKNNEWWWRSNISSIDKYQNEQHSIDDMARRNGRRTDNKVGENIFNRWKIW